MPTKAKQGELMSILSHGMTKTPIYTVWANMKRRCYGVNASHYSDYGGRGIKVCDEWKNSFEAFYKYVGDRPKGMTLDRIDVNGNYEPGNVRWATQQQQVENRRPIGKIKYRGVIQVPNKTYYRSWVHLKGNRINVGNFKDKEEAAYMYDCFVLSLYGDESPTNFDYY